MFDFDDLEEKDRENREDEEEDVTDKTPVVAQPTVAEVNPQKEAEHSASVPEVQDEEAHEAQAGLGESSDVDTTAYWNISTSIAEMQKVQNEDDSVLTPTVTVTGGASREASPRKESFRGSSFADILNERREITDTEGLTYEIQNQKNKEGAVENQVQSVTESAPVPEFQTVQAEDKPQTQLQQVAPMIVDIATPRPGAEKVSPVRCAGGDAFDLLFDRSGGDRLGLQLDLYSEPRALAITEIDSAGIIRDWNDANPRKRICRGDHLVEVDGIRGIAADLAKALRSEKTLKIRIERPHIPEPVLERIVERHQSAAVVTPKKIRSEMPSTPSRIADREVSQGLQTCTSPTRSYEVEREPEEDESKAQPEGQVRSPRGGELGEH